MFRTGILFLVFLVTNSCCQEYGDHADGVSTRVHELEENVALLMKTMKNMQQQHATEIQELKDNIDSLKAGSSKPSNLKSLGDGVQGKLDLFKQEVVESLGDGVQGKLDLFKQEVVDSMMSELSKTNQTLSHHTSELMALTKGLDGCLSQSPRKRQIGTNAQTQVVFSATLHQALTRVHSDDVLKFDSVTINKGSAYSSSTGKFTAATGGTYIFFATIIANNGNQFRSALVKNGIVVAFIHSPRLSEDFGPGSNMAAVTLRAGDTVWIKAVDSHDSLAVDDWSYFTGFLLFPELTWQSVPG